MSSREEDTRRIFGERAAFYTTSSVHRDPEILARVVELAAPEPEWVALDVATGTGHTAFAIAPHVRRVIASDLTPEMLEEAEALRLKHGIPNVELRVDDVHSLPDADGTLQLVTCRRAAHHFSRIHVALDELRRVLVLGGRLVIDDRSVPEHDSVDPIMNELDRLHDESHVREYRPSEWLEMLKRHGFRIDAVETYQRHRPLTALTHDVSPGNVARIHELLAHLTEDERRCFDYREVEGEPHLNHWFLMLGATAVENH